MIFVQVLYHELGLTLILPMLSGPLDGLGVPCLGVPRCGIGETVPEVPAERCRISGLFGSMCSGKPGMLILLAMLW